MQKLKSIARMLHVHILYFMYNVNILYVQCVYVHACMLMSMCKGSIVHSIGTTGIDRP